MVLAYLQYGEKVVAFALRKWFLPIRSMRKRYWLRASATCNSSLACAKRVSGCEMADRLWPCAEMGNLPLHPVFRFLLIIAFKVLLPLSGKHEGMRLGYCDCNAMPLKYLPSCCSQDGLVSLCGVGKHIFFTEVAGKKPAKGTTS